MVGLALLLEGQRQGGTLAFPFIQSRGRELRELAQGLLPSRADKAIRSHQPVFPHAPSTAHETAFYPDLAVWVKIL